MPDEYGHLYEQEERLIKAATRGTPPNYRMRGGGNAATIAGMPGMDLLEIWPARNISAKAHSRSTGRSII